MPLPAGPNGAALKSGNVAFRIVIPNAPPSGSNKRRAFVSPSANGAQVTTYAASNETAALATTVADISSTSSACTSGTSGRTCTITISAPAGSDYFVFALYDAAPVSGAIPASAHELGVAGVTQTITAGATNTVDAPISAIVAGIGATPQSFNEPADGHSVTFAIVIAPTDFGDNPITAGSSNAPYANPIVATVSESGGSGHVLLSLNGGTPAASVTLTKATDTVQAVYDGLGSAGYNANVTLTAPAYNGQGGATQESLTVTPTLFVTNPTVFYSPSPATLNTYPEGQHVLMISEPTASGGTAYTATPTGCSNVLSVGTVIGSGTSATLLVVGGTSVSSSGCSLAISDGTLTFEIAVTNELRSAPASPTIQEYGVGADAPFGITTGADGNLWFTEAGGDAVSYVTDKGTGYKSYPLSSDDFDTPWGDTLGPDGNVWFGDFNTNYVGKITTGGVISVFTGQSYEYTNTFAAGLDGNIWFSECDGDVVGSINTSSGALNEITIPVANAQPYGVALGADGAIWFSDCSNDAIGRIASGTASEFSPTTSQSPYVTTAGSDGATWFTETNYVGRMSSSGTLSEYYINSSANLGFITAGPDGALWFADNGNNAIGRITTSGTITEYQIPTASVGPTGITVGPDGNIWFTENKVGNVGVLQL